MSSVIEVVSNFYGVNPFVVSKGRKYAECRYAIWYFLRYKVDNPYSVTHIARCFNKDHSTVCDGITRLDNLMKYEEPKQRQIKEIEEALVKNLKYIPSNLSSGKRTITVKDGRTFMFKQRKLIKAS